MNRPRPANQVHTSELKAFEVLVKLHHKRLLAYAAALSRRADVAEDLVQEAFITAWRRLGEFDTSKDFGAWLRGIVRLKYQAWGRSKREEPLDDSILETLERVHGRWERAAQHGKADAFAALRDCLERLAVASRETVSLFYMDKLPCAAVAERTGTTENTVRKRLQRAREDLARCIRNKFAATPPGAQGDGR